MIVCFVLWLSVSAYEFVVRFAFDVVILLEFLCDVLLVNCGFGWLAVSCWVGFGSALSFGFGLFVITYLFVF